MRCLQALSGVLFCCLLSACVSIVDMHTPVPVDWPKLEVNTYKAGFLEVQKWCGKKMPLLRQVSGCARIRFDLMRCDIWLVHTTPDYEALAIEEEREHCGGRDHVGSNYLRNLWKRYKASLTKGE